MSREPLPRIMRIRVVVAAVCSGLVALSVLLLVVVGLLRGASPVKAAPLLGIGIGGPVLLGLSMWWQVRRYRNDPAVRRRQLNGAATLVLTVGGPLAVMLGSLARSISGIEGWGGWAVGLVVVVAASLVTHKLAKRHDPRMNLFRRPTPLPPGHEPEDLPPPEPMR